MNEPPRRGARDPKSPSVSARESSSGSSRDLLDQPPFAGSLCRSCAHHRVVRSPRSVFILCTALPDKYPRQPMTSCPTHRPAQ